MTACVVDTSALLAVYLNEPLADRVSQAMSRPDRLLMSTVNLTECLMVFGHRFPDRARDLRQRLLSEPIEFVSVDIDQATLAADARHRFPLNLGDCFAYALARSLNLPLLTLDADFIKTDLTILAP
jgi:ribonuclease VapC